MRAIDINNWMNSLLEQLQRNQQRQLVLLQGSKSWCDKQLEDLIELDGSMQVISNRNTVDTAVPFNQADSCLGGEARLVAMDLFDGFNPDVLCIAAGLVKAGGVLLILSPIFDDRDLKPDHYAYRQGQTRSSRPRFAEYFFSALERDSDTGILLTPNSGSGVLATLPELPLLQPTLIENGQTREQTHCLQRIEQWVSSGQTGVALLNADRGRGKSTCLGLLASRLQASLRIIVTASSRQTAAPLLHQVADTEFFAPDRLLRICPPADLVIIDEAAMIPLSMLRQLCRVYSRLVMATTSGGYEGTGRGFMLRFVASMEPLKLLRLDLELPVRWCRGDRLEAWLNRTLMLDSGVATGSSKTTDLACCEIQLMQDPGAPENRALLLQVYALLNSAHYRTRPSDLRMLMENPDLVLIVARCREIVVGAAMLNLEGGFDDELCAEVFMGRRRPRGHLLAQMLTAQAGLKNFAKYRGIRIQRIAVAEPQRRRGLGSRLIEQALCYGRDNSLDYLGACFALDADTAKFWQQARFELVHISYAPGKSTGSQSIAVLKPIGKQLDTEVKLLQQRIQQQLPTWMTQFLQIMDSAEVTALLRYADYNASIDPLEQQEIEAFAYGNKGFELCFASLQKFVMQCIALSTQDSDNLLVEKAVQNRSWEMLERESGSEGRKQLQQRLRSQVDELLKAC